MIQISPISLRSAYRQLLKILYRVYRVSQTHLSNDVYCYLKWETSGPKTVQVSYMTAVTCIWGSLPTFIVTLTTVYSLRRDFSLTLCYTASPYDLTTSLRLEGRNSLDKCQTLVFRIHAVIIQNVNVQNVSSDDDDMPSEMLNPLVHI